MWSLSGSPMRSPAAPCSDVCGRFPFAMGRPTGCFVLLVITLLAAGGLRAREPVRRDALWSLKPVAARSVPADASSSANPIDDFIAEAAREKGLRLAPSADKLTWLRRVTLDLTGLAPTLAEQDAFLADDSAASYDHVVDRLLRSEQHGVRYGRHWCDVLRYTDVDQDMPSERGIHLWRDWIIAAINNDLPYDQFARAQILGNRAAQRRIISAAGHLTPVEPRPEDLFALGFLSRGATTRDNRDQALAFSAVETVSTAFLGMTVGCAKCHDHFYDPVKQAEYYSMKALFDPLALRQVDLATPEQVFTQGRAVEEYEQKLKSLVDPMRRLIEPYHSRLYEERLLTFPKDVQVAIRKPERDRTAAEQKIYDDYYPILRIDPPKLKAVMPEEVVRKYDEFLKRIDELKPPGALPGFWTVEEDSHRLTEKSYVLLTGDPTRPRKDLEVQPGFPFADRPPEFRAGRRETFVDWLTDASNPLFARVVVNRVWYWHFGSGLHASVSDFGALGGKPVHPALLDWLASEFVARGYSMKWLHRLITTSETYRRASVAQPELEAANAVIDPDDRHYWRFPLRRLEAEPLRDTLLQVASALDLTIGGRSFENVAPTNRVGRRTAFLRRGYRSYQDIMPDYLETFDVEDGRQVCTRRTQTVTAPQALWLMNNELGQQASMGFSERLLQESSGDLALAIQLGYRHALGRVPSDSERAAALSYVGGETGRLRGFAWMLFNLDEFLYVR